MRIGFGYDSHRLVEGRRLVLCGVEVPFDRGLSGWSDADVATHAVIDALCGAAGLGDIGTLFPAGDERYHDASSLRLLEQTCRLVYERGLHPVNVDITVIAEKPVLAPHVAAMRKSLAAAMRIERGFVSIKAKTNECMGFVGRGEGIAAIAAVLLE